MKRIGKEAVSVINCLSIINCEEKLWLGEKTWTWSRHLLLNLRMLKVSDTARLGALTLNLNAHSRRVMPPDKAQWEKAVPWHPWTMPWPQKMFSPLNAHTCLMFVLCQTSSTRETLRKFTLTLTWLNLLGMGDFSCTGFPIFPFLSRGSGFLLWGQEHSSQTS